MSGIEWVNSYVTDNKIYCVYNADNKDLVSEHAKCGGFPADSIETVSHVIGPSWGETERVKAVVTNLLSTADYGSSVVSSDFITIFSYFYIQPKEINEICKYEICKYEYKYIYIIVVEHK